MKTKRFEIITCPFCDREYLPAEIFVPSGFFGKPVSIEKEYTGKIIEYSGDAMDLKESYICDKCNTKFNVNAKIQFFTTPSDSSNFNEESTLSLGRCNLLMSED